MWPAQRVIETSRANGDDEKEKKTDNNGNEITTVIVVPEQAKLSESERNKIRDAHNDFHDRYGYV
jgi:hypothetical protein